MLFSLKHPLATALADFIFPRECLSCSSEGAFICAPCQSKLTRLVAQRCIVCNMSSTNGYTHAACATDELPDGLVSLYEYSDPIVSQSIIWGKYKFLPDIFALLGQLASQILQLHGNLSHIQNPLIVPIPLAPSRLRWRGFNQSALMAREVSAMNNCTYLPNALYRVRTTRTQKDLTRVQRKHNVTDAFAAGASSQVLNRNIILVDDVATTGITLCEAAKVLKTAGSAQVWGLTLARD